MKPYDTSFFASVHHLHPYHPDTVTFPSFKAVSDPWKKIDIGAYAKPAFADLDNDGDQDLIAGSYKGTFTYFENTDPKSPSGFTERTGTTNPFLHIDLGDFSAPSFADLDNDGDLDMVAGRQSTNSDQTNTLVYFENTGSATAPIFTERTGAQDPLHGLTSLYAPDQPTPTLVDLDNDGDYDLVFGQVSGTFGYFENTGSATAPVFTARKGGENPLDGIDVGYYSAPVFVDIDNDGQMELVAGGYDGELHYYDNVGTQANPAFSKRPSKHDPFEGIKTSGYATPAVADLDGDGDLDFLIGKAEGEFVYVENTTPDIVTNPNVSTHIEPAFDFSPHHGAHLPYLIPERVASHPMLGGTGPDVFDWVF